MIDLSELRLRAAPPELLEFGGVVAPPTGGVSQTIDRLGTRWSRKFVTVPVDMEPEGRRWAALLMRARREGGRMPIPQPGLNIGSPGQPTIGSETLSGRSLPLFALEPGYALRLGQWITVEVEGRRYSDMVASPAIANTDGAATVEIMNLLRVPLPIGAKVEIGRPTIEGSITEFAEYQVDVDEVTSFAFTISEDA